MGDNIEVAGLYDEDAQKQEIAVCFRSPEGEWRATPGMTLNAEQARGLAHVLLVAARWHDDPQSGDFRLVVECDFSGW